MKQIRRGVFETNSSSTHSLTMCSGDDFEKWKNGEVYYAEDTWGSESEFAKLDFVTVEQAIDILAKNKYYKGTDPHGFSKEELENALKENDMRLLTYDKFGSDLEYFEDTYTTPSGEVVVAFGEYGYEG